MIRKKVCFPILFFVILGILFSCNDSISNQEYKEYTLLKTKGDTALYKKVQLDSAYFFYNQAKDKCNNKSGEEYAYALLQMATIQQYVGDFYGAEETITEGLANYKGKTYQPYFYNMLAISYDKQKNFDGALEYYKKAFETFSDDTAKAIAQNNIGLVHLENGQYEKALAVLRPLLKNQSLKNNKIETARVFDNLGYAQFKLKHPDTYTNLSESLQLRDSLKDHIGLIPSNIHLSEYFKERDKAMAHKHAIKALLSAQKINSPDDKLEALRWIIENSEPTIANKYSPQFFQLNDSLQLVRSAAKNQFAKIKYDATRALQAVEIQKGQKQLYFIFFLSAVLLSILLYFLIRSKNRNKLKTISYATETHISKKLHDELANDVYNAMTFAETQDLQLPDKKEALIDNLDKIYNRTRNISKENSSINTDDKFENDLKDMISGYSNSKVNVITKNLNTIGWSKLAVEKKIAIYRVSQELLVNMKKHSEANLVMLSFESTPRFVDIQYTDNGKGIDNDHFSKKGLQNAENRIHAVKGTFIFDQETSKGFKVTIQIPK
ncbi:tetratricopeptide repeat protein [Flavobacterium sp. UBA7680]|uniref:ATP-binding protein n=1 Tax=Flavobacterium sp. UBA7680 TaxID=1946559 RepID=UPI0025C15568|nr:tetratricopeptide repeat protein [Flavobacterium sp. UBA7680]